MKDGERMLKSIAAESEEDAYRIFHECGNTGWFKTEEVLVDGKHRLIKFRARSGTTIYEIQKRSLLFFWKTLSFNGLDWFADVDVAMAFYTSVITPIRTKYYY